MTAPINIKVKIWNIRSEFLADFHLTFAGAGFEFMLDFLVGTVFAGEFDAGLLDNEVDHTSDLNVLWQLESKKVSTICRAEF
jgi:hypothetical protein